MKGSRVQIYEHPSDEGSETVDIVLQIPISFELYGVRTNEEYKTFLLERVNEKTTVIFRLLDFLGRQYEQTNTFPSYFGEFIQLASQFGEGLQEAASDVADDFDKKKTYKWSPLSEGSSDNSISNSVASTSKEEQRFQRRKTESER